MIMRLTWTSEDGQATLDGGTHHADAERTVAEGVWLAELLDQCADERQRDEIERGHMTWNEES